MPHSYRSILLTSITSLLFGFGVASCSAPETQTGETGDTKLAPTPAIQVTEAPETTTELNLSLDLVNGIVNETAGDELLDPQLMPNLVGQGEEAGRVNVNGKLLTDKEAIDMQDKIEGVEFKIEILTN